MEFKKPEWNKEELLAYVLIYCMNADCDEDVKEIAYIREEVGDEIYVKMHDEFCKDNDFISLEKIKASYRELELDYKEKDRFFHDIEEIFGIDGRHDAIEQGIHLGLNRILKDM